MAEKRKMEDIWLFPRAPKRRRSQSTEPGKKTQRGRYTEFQLLRLRGSTAAGSLHQGSKTTYRTRARDEYRSKQKMAAYSDVKVKKEPDEDDKEVSHKHRFYIQFEAKDNRPYEINGKDFQTVLQAIRSIEKHPAQEWPVEKLLIQREVGGSESTIATHFPCCLIKEDEMLTISKRRYIVEVGRKVLPKESYSVFYIDAQGAKNTSARRLLISSQRKGLKPLCVYGEKGITAKEALERDGRFKTFSSFKLIDCNNYELLKSSAVTNDLHGREFKIELPNEKPTNVPQESESPTKSAKEQKRIDMAADGMAAASNTAAVSALSEQRGISVKKALSESSSDADRKQIEKILHNEFPDLKKIVKSRFPADSLEKELSVREENFRKVPQSFGDFYTLGKLIRMGKLVCKVIVEDVTGTGFVLFDNFIMTSAHLFKTCTDGDRLKKGVDVHVLFNYEDPLTGQSRPFKVEDGLICSTEGELDYAVLVVNHEVFKQFKTEQKVDNQFPSGLLERVGEIPENGEVCIIGHPEGEVKQMDQTFIIEMEKRKQAVEENLSQHTDKLHILFDDQVKKNGIKRILMGGADAEKVITYHTFMYHGASGSPVFDPDGFLCGLHTSGFFYGIPKATESAIEFGYPMKIIITHFVKRLREKNETDMLERMKAAAGKNDVLEKIF